METSFGNWVRRRRKGLDLTQDELARRVGCSSSLIFKIETDERRPSRQIAELLAEQLEIPSDQRSLFLKVARQDLSALRLDLPELPPPISSAKPPAPADQPLPEAPSPRPTNLPVFPTLLVGREPEIDIVTRQLIDPACRLLTLTGPGGVGKTRLAVEVARRLEDSFPDGVIFLAMAGVSQAESILTVLADALGIIFSGPADPRHQVIQTLRPKNMLIVFDNMEHLITGSAVLGELLQEAPGVRMLLTSREPVHLQWEWIFEVQGLPVPESVQPGVLESNSAPALFLQRTRQAARQISPTLDEASPAETAAIVLICQLVDGLPLAIELAASWARVMSPTEIAGELAHGLDLLETTLQDVPARHRSIRLVFDHSWKLLTDEERTALMKLAVFPGGFTREMAQRVADVSFIQLSVLVDKSLLRFGKKAGRYDFHELVRQYVLGRLSEQPELEQCIYTRLAEVYARWIFDQEMLLKSSEQIEASARIRAETGNWTAAWHWAARHQRVDLLRLMEPCISWYEEVHGGNTEAMALTEYAVRVLRAAGIPDTRGTDEEKATFALLVDQQGWVEFRTGNLESALERFNESLALAQETKEPDHEVLYYININWGYLALIAGDFETSREKTQTSLEHALAMGKQWHAAISTSVLGIGEYQRGNVQAAYQQLSDSLRLWRQIGDLRGLVFTMLYLSAAALDLGKYEVVESTVQESNAIAHKKMDRWALAFGLDLLGQAAVARGQWQTAREYFSQSLPHSLEIDDQWAATLCTIHLAEVHLALGEQEEGYCLLRQAYAASRHANWLPVILEALIALVYTGDELALTGKLAILQAVLVQSTIYQSTRQRAARLRAELAAQLQPEQVEAVSSQVDPKSVEQWAEELFGTSG
jgi:predicted ATPase/transcriptional regulator with XRE-family HTH domain